VALSPVKFGVSIAAAAALSVALVCALTGFGYCMKESASPNRWAFHNSAAKAAFLSQWTAVPPSVYISQFRACSERKACDQTAEFSVARIPTGCCVLSLTNGNGKGGNEVRRYDVYLNGVHVVGGEADGAASHYANANVKIRSHNSLRVVLFGPATSTVFVEISYDPRQPK
jgi:hypothetical protein